MARDPSKLTVTRLESRSKRLNSTKILVIEIRAKNSEEEHTESQCEVY